jgi:hypothetical protein
MREGSRLRGGFLRPIHSYRIFAESSIAETPCGVAGIGFCAARVAGFSGDSGRGFCGVLLVSWLCGAVHFGFVFVGGGGMPGVAGLTPARFAPGYEW